MVIAEDEIVDRFQLKSVIVPVKIRTRRIWLRGSREFSRRRTSARRVLRTHGRDRHAIMACIHLNRAPQSVHGIA